jgi:RNA 2',3'-cyclic 3'-phosphodiesterase
VVRLFVAVDMDQGVRAAVTSLIHRLESLIGGAGRRGPVKWVEPENLHLTVRFVGEADEPSAERLRRAFTRPIGRRPFDVSFDGVGSFPDRGTPRVIWIGTVAGGSELEALHAETEKRVRAAGFQGEDRPFRAHLTIGRVREGSGGPGIRRAIAEVAEATIGRCRVDHLTLYRSRLSSKGPTYTPLARAALLEAQEE